MNPPPPQDLDSGSVQALLARLRAAQGTADSNPPPQNGTPEQYPSTATYGQNHQAAPFNFPNSASTSYGDPPGFHPPERGRYDPFNRDEQHQQPPGKIHDGPTPSGSVRSLLSSLQSTRPCSEYPAPSQPPYTALHYPLPVPSASSSYHQSPPAGYSAHSHHSYTIFPQTATPNPYVFRRDDEPRARPPSPNRPSPPRHLPSPDPPELAVADHAAAHPASSVAPAATSYDPYDEDFAPPSSPTRPPPSEHAASDTSDAPGIDEEAAARAKEEDERARLVERRSTDDFVNMSFERASAVVTQLLNEESVMRRLRELKEEQDKMERQLWQKRLDIVKTHRERMNKAKEEATRMDPRKGQARVMKEKSAAQRALKQYYTSRCLPFYDDLHRKHLHIMAEELGIPGLGRLEARRNKTSAAAPGGAERPISIDSDDDDDDDGDGDAAEQEAVAQIVVGGMAEEERGKMMARRKKIMDLIESIMSEGLDD